MCGFCLRNQCNKNVLYYALFAALVVLGKFFQTLVSKNVTDTIFQSDTLDPNVNPNIVSDQLLHRWYVLEQEMCFLIYSFDT